MNRLSQKTEKVTRREPDEVSRFVERFAVDLAEAGMQRMPARVFAALLASDSGSLTSAELSQRLQVSPAAISGAIRYLGHVNMVGREREPGARCDRYRLYDAVWFETYTRRDQLLPRWNATLRDGARALGPDTPAGRRVLDTVEFFEFVKREMAGVLDRWRLQRG